jgi:hypothetical protein
MIAPVGAAFEIFDHAHVRSGNSFSVTLRSSLTLDQLVALLCREHVPVTAAQVVRADERYTVTYPEAIGPLAGLYFCNLHVAQLTGVNDSRSFALESLRREYPASVIQETMPWLQEQTVREYYRRIDNSDLNWIAKLFDVGAVYIRGEDRYVGQPRIIQFFRAERKIRGSHRVDEVIVHGGVAIARGHFSGRGADDSPKEIDFCDVWVFNPEGRVVSRQTYLGGNASYVKE